MTKYNFVYFWKIIYTYMILILHYNLFNNPEALGMGWYIAVEFFFVVSGYLVAVDSDRGGTTGIWLRKRLVGLYPLYLLGFIQMFLLRTYCIGVADKAKSLIEHYPEILGIHVLGFRMHDYINDISWYVPVYIAIGTLLHYLYKNHRESFLYIIGPIFILGFGGYFFRTVGCLDVWNLDYVYLPCPMTRAALGMSVGMFAYHLSKSKIGLGGWPLIFMQFFCLSVVAVAKFVRPWDKTDFLCLILIAVGVAVSFHQDMGETNISRILKWFSSQTYAIYIHHLIFSAFVFPHFLAGRGNQIFTYALYLLVATAYGIAVNQLWNVVSRRLRIKLNHQ